MARVTYGASVTEFAGSIGGVTFQRNASGPIAKLRSNPTVNPTALQAKYQHIFSMLVAYWPTISPEDKDLWDVIAAAHDHTTPWGETKTLSGYQWFMLCNLLRFREFDTPRNYPGTWYAAPPPDQFTIETSATYIHVVWSPDYNTPFDLLFYASLPLRQSSLKLRRSTFFIKFVSLPGSLTNYDLTPEISALYNVTWADFYASANCNIIIRVMHGHVSRGYLSQYTSALVKIS